MTAASPPSEPQQVQITVDWSAAESLPVMAANLFYVQQTTHEFVLTFGMGTTPYFPSAPTLDQIKGTKIKAQPLFRMAVSPGRLVELLQLLQQHIAVFQQSQRH